MRGFYRLTGALAAFLVATTLAAPALAQTSTPQTFIQVDENGVDLTTGWSFWSMTEGSIGSGEGAVALEREWAGPAGWRDNWTGVLYQKTTGGTPLIYIEFGAYADTFTISGTTYTSTKANGATLVGGTYTAADGTQVIFSSVSDTLGYPYKGPYPCQLGDNGVCSIPVSVRRPNGMTFTYQWDVLERCSLYDPELNCLQPAAYYRFRGITSSANYKFTVNFATDVPGGGTGAPVPDWYKKTNVQFTNLTGAPSPLPTVTYGYPSSLVVDVTDIGGRTWRLANGSGGKLTGIRRPGSASDTTTYVYGGTGGVVSSVTNEGVTKSYARTVAGNSATMTVTDALSNSRVITSDLTIGRPTSYRDELIRTTSFQYDANGRLTRTTKPEGNYVQLTYDARGNVVQSRAVSKTAGTPADIVTSAGYDATCTNVVKCNKPNSSTDARGNVTDFTYDPTHGGLLTSTSPAPSAGAVRPQTRFTYGQVTAIAGQPVYLLTGTSACQTLASCAGAADEVKGTIGYSSTNLLPITKSAGNGTGTLTATSTMTYDAAGNMLTVDGPLPGTADTTRTRYNAARDVIGVIGPDPDGAGILKYRATRNSYTNGLLTKIERGTVNSQSDPDWAAFAPLETVDLVYDANARVTQRKLSNGATTYALGQSSYDALGRPDCSTVRMNSATFASPPASACTLGTQGSFGPDRIGKTIYDAAGQVTQKQVAVGTSDAATETTLSYTQNAMLATLKDAENNLTTYEYDGFDRLSKTRMPFPTKGAGASSSTDYEQLTYDAASNVTSRRLRDAASMGFTYDNLNRVTLKDLPGAEPDVTTAYDNLGRLTSASQTGNALSFTYDALNRNLTQTGPQGTATSAYDLAGRRTQLTYPGSGLFVTYDYLLTYEMTAIRENGATTGAGVLATLTYDDLGRRTAMAFGNGAAQAYGYDPVSRLASLANDVVGSSNDLNQTFTYNPASQIASVIRSNDAFAWTGHGAGSTASVANGLNQLTSIGGAATAHDARGNLTSDPVNGKTYAYSSENLLTSSSGGTAASLTYDPLSRLSQLSAATTTRFGYDGTDMIAEYDGANAVMKRYVFGPGVDEPLVEYTGPGTTTKRFLHADERGTIVAISDNAGNLAVGNRFDEFGKPFATNQGRFQYTGQMWLSEIGVYYYKARMYAPHLPRFLQTDPIGVEGGVNLYAYVGNDPVNRTDSSGLCAGGRICAAQRDRADAALKAALAAAGFSTRDLYGDDLYNYASDVIGQLEAQEGYQIVQNFLNYDPSSLIYNAKIEFEEANYYSADRQWITKFSAIPNALSALESNFRAVMTGLLVSDRAAMSAPQAGLPGDRQTYYNRYSVYSLPNFVPGVLNGPRIFYNSPSAYIYFAPFHGKSGPGVPSGFIQFRINRNGS